jgi:hypothetical protein
MLVLTNPKYTKPVVLESAPVFVGAVYLGRHSIAFDFRRFGNKIDAWLRFLFVTVRNISGLLWRRVAR